MSQRHDFYDSLKANDFSQVVVIASPPFDDADI